jgi:hypothetical protein
VNGLVDDLSGELDQFPFLENLFADGLLSGITPLAHAVLYGQERVYVYLAPLTAIALRTEAEVIAKAKPSGALWPYGAPAKTTSASQAIRDALLADSAAARRWVWSCLLCGRQGHKPDMPGEIDRRGTAEKVRRMFKVLPLGKNRQCERCVQKVAASLRRIEEKHQKRLAAPPPELKVKRAGMKKKPDLMS